MHVQQLCGDSAGAAAADDAPGPAGPALLGRLCGGGRHRQVPRSPAAGAPGADHAARGAGDRLPDAVGSARSGRDDPAADLRGPAPARADRASDRRRRDVVAGVRGTGRQALVGLEPHERDGGHLHDPGEPVAGGRAPGAQWLPRHRHRRRLQRVRGAGPGGASLHAGPLLGALSRGAFYVDRRGRTGRLASMCNAGTRHNATGRRGIAGGGSSGARVRGERARVPIVARRSPAPCASWRDWY